MIRVVLDTNIIVSALLRPEGIPAQLLLLAIKGNEIQLCVSGEIYAEYEEVIRRPRFKRSESEITNTLRAVQEKGFWVKPKATVNACVDPDDNIFLECAAAAEANYLITGNVKHFPSTWAGIQVISPRQFLDVLAGIPGALRLDQ
jgi:putative PIN family toxin of toxin-antitoxin system